MTPSEAEEESLSDDHLIRVYQLAELFEGRFRAALTDDSWDKNLCTMILIENPAVRLVSSYIHNHALFLRLLNVTNSAQDTKINLRLTAHAAYKCKLNEDVISEIAIEPVEHTPFSRISLLPGKNELMTIRLDLD